MDAHVFRLIGQELLLLLSGARVEKIHGPFPDVTIFQLFKDGLKFRLALRCGQNAPALFFCAQTYPNPQNPPSAVMRLRKYVAGLRLGTGQMDFLRRVLVFPVLKKGEEQDVHLVLDLRKGPSIVLGPMDALTLAPAVWPDDTVIDALCLPVQHEKKEGVASICSSSQMEVDASALWKRFPQFTPLLRETLSYLDALDGRALMVDLEAGGGDIFFYSRSFTKENHCKSADFYTAWPLPNALANKKKLVAVPTPYADTTLVNVCPLLAATSVVDEHLLCTQYAQTQSLAQEAPIKKQKKRIDKTLDKLDKEEERLKAMLALRKEAILLQENLWKVASDYKTSAFTVSLPDGTEQSVSLNPLLTVRENMEKMFHQSARGKRGLAMLEQRRKELVLTFSEEQGVAAPSLRKEEAEALLPSGTEDTVSTGPVERGDSGNPQVARFVSSDGYVLLRGKNAKGNQAVLKMGQPYDYWLHAENGPSAHLIIRRAHPNDEIPERTVQEAARLVAEKSWQRNDGRAEVMLCLVKHVHPIKGASAGTVRVDRIFMQLRVMLDASA